jgi:AraC family transcriptional regulator, regulatory protein of adaptative response / methylated-DNA-[protein]-cysteine methyltransferase
MIIAANKTEIYYESQIDTLLGLMTVIADDEKLHLLEFSNKTDLEKEIAKLKQRNNTIIMPGKTAPINMIKQELELYFAGKLKVFKTPVYLKGSNFQNKAWHALTQIPYGQTRSYLEQAKSIGQDKAFRAVANANAANQLAVIIPCHRIIRNNGALGGYAGGIARKEWLIMHEAEHA